MKLLRQLRIAFAWALALFANVISPTRAEAAEPPRRNEEFLVYIGTYTGPKSKGIYVSHFDLSTGRPGAPELAAETPSPSFLAVHPNHRFLYAVNEIGDFAGKK